MITSNPCHRSLFLDSHVFTTKDVPFQIEWLNVKSICELRTLLFTMLFAWWDVYPTVYPTVYDDILKYTCSTIHVPKEYLKKFVGRKYHMCKSLHRVKKILIEDSFGSFELRKCLWVLFWNLLNCLHYISAANTDVFWYYAIHLLLIIYLDIWTDHLKIISISEPNISALDILINFLFTKMSLIKRKYSGIETISTTLINSLELNFINKLFFPIAFCIVGFYISVLQTYLSVMQKLIDCSS